MIHVDSKKAKVKVTWRVNQYDFNQDAVDEIKSIVSQKYGVNKRSIRVEPKIINENGEVLSLSVDEVKDIKDPNFQRKLFEEYLKLNKVENYDFDEIIKIDNEVNAKINYQDYDKFKRYSVKYIKFSNFLSYGADNYLDFTSFGKFVLLNGSPGNQSGKTTLSIDLLHFLLFGKTTKVTTQEKIFNKHLPEATKVEVEGCITIDGEDYIIKRTLSRPALNKRTDKSKVTQKIEYFKVVGDENVLLEDMDTLDMKGDSTRQTNQVIKEAIGREDDFDLMLSITGTNIDDLIEKKDTERGRLLTRWIGLLPIEEKEKEAKEIYKNNYKSTFKSNYLSVEVLEQDTNQRTKDNESYEDNIKKFEEKNKVLDEDIKVLETSRDGLIQSKKTINQSVLDIDIVTLDRTLESIANKGIAAKSKLQECQNELNSIGEIEFSQNLLDDKTRENMEVYSQLNVSINEYNNTQNRIKQLKDSEFCPTCGRKYDNVDNSQIIVNEENKLNELNISINNLRENYNRLANEVYNLKLLGEQYTQRNKLIASVSYWESEVTKLRMQYQEQNNIKKEYITNKEAIDENKQLDIKINDVISRINVKREEKEGNIRYIAQYRSSVESNQQIIKNNNQVIIEIENEKKLIRNWELYLEMIGKNGISKMVFRTALPLVNMRLYQLLDGICDFEVKVSLNDKNEAQFDLIKDGVTSDLKSASGFEKTCAGLALRSALTSVSTMPSCNFITMDEIIGRVAAENFDNFKELIERIGQSYDFILMTTHNSAVKDWFETIITICKENNVSYIKTSKK